MRSDSSESSKQSRFDHIRSIVAQIPLGSVSTYGTIAAMPGTRDARQVGWAVYGNQNPLVPCHRVVNKQGYLAKDFSLGGWEEQKRRLVPEGITFTEPNRVDMEKHMWSGEKSNDKK
jgi:alkylated DNA nucleotide flippase Atl1